MTGPYYRRHPRHRPRGLLAFGGAARAGAWSSAFSSSTCDVARTTNLPMVAGHHRKGIGLGLAAVIGGTSLGL